MPTFYDVPADALINALADRLADEVEEPEWARYTKAGADRELAPEQDDFWERRAASLLRRIGMEGPVGIGTLRTHYGGSKEGSNRYGVSPASQSDGSGKIIRTIVQQLQSHGYVEEAGSAGRQLTADGRSLLDETAGEVLDDLIEDRPELERYA